MNNKPPSLITRARAALNVFRSGLPSGLVVKEAPFAWPVWRDGKPEWHLVDLNSYITEGFNLNSLIYSALMYKARSITNAPLRAYEGDLDHPVLAPANSPLAKLLARPNTYQSQLEFMQLADVYLNIAGGCPIALDRPKRGGFPTAMYALRPDRVFIVPKERNVIGYIYIPEGKSAHDAIPYLPEDLIYVKFPNPGDPLEGMGYGLSPLSAGSQSADVDNDATKFLKTFFKKGTMINTYLKYDVPLTDAQVARARDRFSEVYGGYGNWSQVGVMDSGAELKQFGMNFRDMGFDVIDERNESKVLGPFGVPPSLLGTRMSMSTGTYANRASDRVQFWEDTMLPELTLFETEFQYFLREGDSFPAFDTSKVPALRKDVPTLVTAWTQLVGLGVPKHQAAETVGLELGDLPDGDVVYMPFSLIAMNSSRTPVVVGDSATATSDTRKMLPPATPLAALLAASKRQLSPEQKAAHWKANDATARKWEGKFAEGARKAFGADKRNILAIISDAQKAARQAKATIDWTDSNGAVDDYLMNAGADNWRSTFVPLMEGVITDQGTRWAAELGMEFDTRNLYGEAWFDAYTLQFAQPINDTTSQAIHDILAQGQVEGWSVPQMQANLTMTFDQWMDGDIPPEDFDWLSDRMPPYRTELISRDQTMRASNAGTSELFSQWKVKQKEWLSTKDDRVRDEHLAADGQVVDMDEPFKVGGHEMMFPGDDSRGAPIEMFIQDRCTVLPVME